MAPPAVPSFEATMACMSFFVLVRESSVMRCASSGFHSLANCSEMTFTSPRSITGLRMFIWPLRSSSALLSVGAPPMST
jgi:hypothetical protein